jgi:hypothetical protein
MIVRYTVSADLHRGWDLLLFKSLGSGTTDSRSLNRLKEMFTDNILWQKRTARCRVSSTYFSFEVRSTQSSKELEAAAEA